MLTDTVITEQVIGAAVAVQRAQARGQRGVCAQGKLGLLPGRLVVSLSGVLGVICMAGILCSPMVHAADQIVILGDGNSWLVKHHGSDSQTFLGANADMSPCASVAAALELAQKTNRVEFDACFYNLDSEPRRQWAERLFNQWQSYSWGHTHLIVDEALVSVDGTKGTRSNIAAVSVSPFVPNDQRGEVVTAPGARPTAVLLTNVNSRWKITVPRQGEPVLNFLTKQALREVNPNAYVQETVQRAAEQLEANNLLARQMGLIPQDGPFATAANAARERFELQNKGVVITNWTAWKEYFNCQELNPPRIYDVRDAWTPDFSTPLSAQRSYRHALYVADGETLYDHADDGRRAAFEFTYGKDWVVNRTNLILFPEITQITVLFTATTKFEGFEYVLVFIRAQEAENPTDGRVTFQSDIFKRTKRGYLKTADFNYSNLFGNPEQAARLQPTMVPRYPKLLEQASKSEFPAHYYTIDE
jgi:hypothetical protein